jgi:hypothetical protein
MKTAFSGVRYDVSKAILVGEAERHFGKLDGWRAKLCCTPRAGRYFLAGRGGWMTRWRGEQGIIPLTCGEARAWTEQYLDKTALATMAR